MRPLLSVVVALAMLWSEKAWAAPQPLSFNSSTRNPESELTKLSSTEETRVDSISDLASKVSSTVSDEPTTFSSISSGLTENSVTLTSDKKEATVENKSGTLPLKHEVEVTTVIESKTDDKLSTESEVSVPNEPQSSTIVIIDSKNINSISSTEPSTSLDISEGTEDSDVEVMTISKYVPPLDPVKHMMMMSDRKKAQSTTPVEEKLETTSFSPSTSDPPEEISTKRETELNIELADVTKEETELHELNKEQNSPTSASTSNIPILILKSEDISSDQEMRTVTEVDISSTPGIKESSPTAGSSSELSSSETSAETNEKLATKEDHSVNLKSEIPSEISPTSEVIETTKLIEETAETSSSIPSTETVTVSKDSKDEESMIRSGEAELKSDPIADSSEASALDEASELSTDTLKINEETSKRSELVSTVVSTEVPETTSQEDSTTKLSFSENEKPKNVSLEDELEFRAVKLSLNASKVNYVHKDPELPSKSDIETDDFAETLKSEEEPESTTSNILTTIRELLFSTEASVDKSSEEITESKQTTFSSEEPDIQKVKSPEPAFAIDTSDIADMQPETAAVLEKESADVLEVNSSEIGLDSAPAKEIELQSSTTIKPISAGSVTEKESLELLNSQANKNADKVAETLSTRVPTTTIIPTDNPTSSEEIQESEVSESVAETTTTETVHVVTTEEFQAETLPTEVPKSQSIEALENTPEIVSDPKLEGKPSEYGTKTQDRYVSGNNTDSVAAVQFLHFHDKASSEQCFKLVDAHWNYATNLTDENKKRQLAQTLEYSLFHKEAWKNATSFAWKSFNDTLLRRWFKSLSVLGTAALPEDKLNEFNRLKAEMKNTYSTAKVCPYTLPALKKGQKPKDAECNLTLEPDLTRILTKSRDYDELTHVWKAWRDAAGKPIREKFLRFVNLSNEAARLNGFSDTGDMWREAYESETFEEDLESLWNQLKPLYEHLHAYVRRKLIQEYGKNKIKEDGPIPAHLFGNMWAQSWVSLLDITQPYPGKPSVDVTPIMEAKNMTALEMFKISEEFFTSLGLKPMPEEFWKHSLIEKPKDREIICHASAWDFCNGKDYRIKQCTDITMEDLITVHHEMGHIQYFLQYARQPNVFREGANPGFHEAIGDVLALSVSTPKHLKSIGLLKEVADDPEGDLNFLLRTALDKVSFLPSGYLIDLWRWGLFSGDIKTEEMNTKWWDLRLKYQGICPPVKRTDTDFDPGAKYHVPGNVPYIRYFVSFVIQFQFHKVLCDAAGHTGPLYKCDIYQSKEAGQILSQVMELGSSEHWSEAMKIMTGGATNKMDAGPILEYFEPLLKFLEEQNKNETLGWKSEDSTICP
ncbi:uncharacterized protein LOC118195242 [Stegodyphus dumicola]|uniref:uncharacterized protein LOC118195242 n=1 Tax=Stegodyphus dumicola TaxID=202533 RepID=UPI0015A9C379|nr:uncharacterized protein LOC118195242 [Stegodyphus dumicola]